MLWDIQLDFKLAAKLNVENTKSATKSSQYEPMRQLITERGQELDHHIKNFNTSRLHCG